jgi:hypothetical protein
VPELTSASLTKIADPDRHSAPMATSSRGAAGEEGLVAGGESSIAVIATLSTLPAGSR